MISQAATVDEYLRSLPADRRAAIEAVRAVILKNLDAGYREGMQYGMIGYFVPHSLYPPGYHCDPKQPLPFACLASQKNYMSVYLGCLYGDADLAWFRGEWAKTGKNLDMGKSCIRFKTLDHLPVELIGQAIARVPARKFIAYYESVIKTRGQEAKSQSPVEAKPAKKVPVTKAPLKKAPAKPAPAAKAAKKANAKTPAGKGRTKSNRPARA